MSATVFHIQVQYNRLCSSVEHLDRSVWKLGDILFDVTSRDAAMWTQEAMGDPTDVSFTNVLMIDSTILPLVKDAFAYYESAIKELLTHGIEVDLDVKPSDIGLQKRIGEVDERASFYSFFFNQDSTFDQCHSIDVHLCRDPYVRYVGRLRAVTEQEMVESVHQQIRDMPSAETVALQITSQTFENATIFHNVQPCLVRALCYGDATKEYFVPKMGFGRQYSVVVVVRLKEFEFFEARITTMFPDAKIRKLPKYGNFLTLDQGPGVWRWVWCVPPHTYLLPANLIEMVIGIVMSLCFLPRYVLIEIIEHIPAMNFLPRKVLDEKVGAILKSIEKVVRKRDGACRCTRSKTK